MQLTSNFLSFWIAAVRIMNDDLLCAFACEASSYYSGQFSMCGQKEGKEEDMVVMKRWSMATPNKWFLTGPLN